jgi:hypothetical protein
MELSHLLSNTAAFTATYLGHDFNMKVNTEKLTPTYKAKLIELITADDPEARKDENAQMLSDLVAEWDVVLNGNPFAPSYENIMQLSYLCITSLLKQIQGFLGDLVNPQNAQS